MNLPSVEFNCFKNSCSILTKNYTSQTFHRDDTLTSVWGRHPAYSDRIYQIFRSRSDGCRRATNPAGTTGRTGPPAHQPGRREPQATARRPGLGNDRRRVATGPLASRTAPFGGQRILLLTSRQAGKSAAAAALALCEALLVPGSLVLLLSPSERQSGELQAKVFDYYDALACPCPPANARNCNSTYPTVRG